MLTFTFTFENIIKLSYGFRDNNKIVMISPPLEGKILLKVEDIIHVMLQVYMFLEQFLPIAKPCFSLA